MRILPSVIISMTLIAGVLGARRADACGGCFQGRDGKTQPGTACQVEYPDRNHSWGYTSLGRICNFDPTEEVRVICPLLRDTWGNTDGLQCASATLVRQGGAADGCQISSRKNWQCIVQSKDASGYFGWWSGLQPIDANFDTSQLIANNMLQQDWRWSLQNSYIVGYNYLEGGHYYLSCALPPVNNCGGENCVSELKWAEQRP